MKILYLIRHAKSSWSDVNLSDFDRPLNSRGFRDCETMPQFLKDKNMEIDYILSSTALRAKTTALQFNKVFQLNEDKIQYTKELYHALDFTVVDLINQVNPKINHLAVFGHNPTFTYLANKLCEIKLDNLPTCGIVAIGFEISEWTELMDKKGNFLFFNSPKNL